MSGTNHSSGGFRRITRLGQPVKIRMLGFMIVVVCGTLLITWITRTTWVQLARLQKEHAAIKSESFYLGVTLRSAVRSLNGKLLQYGLSKDPAVRDAFTTEAGELKSLIATNRAELADLATLRLGRRIGLSSDLQLLERVERTFEGYLSHTAQVLTTGPPPQDLDTFQEVFERVQSSSRELLACCDQLVTLQRQGFGDFLAETQHTLRDHQLLLKATSVLILVMAAMLGIIIYRNMIAPLQRGLTQSSKIIERQEKLASLGVLASGVAHEIRNPLTAIKFRLFSLKKTVPALANSEDASTIASEINRLERIVKDVLRFARPSEPALAPVPAARVLQETRQLLKAQLERSGIQLTVEPWASAWVHADAQQIKQVLINLVQNAAEAIGRNGRIQLGLRTEDAQLDGRSMAAAVLSVRDNGKGIAPEVEARLFDPFFTTKDSGTGLGLAIAARIVEMHGGILRYETQLNRGTTFEVVLPRVEHEIPEAIVD